MLEKVKPAAIGARPASVFVNWQVGDAEDNPSQTSRQVIRVELTGSDTCTALGLAINSSSPVLALCRALIEAGQRHQAIFYQRGWQIVPDKKGHRRWAPPTGGAPCVDRKSDCRSAHTRLAR